MKVDLRRFDIVMSSLKEIEPSEYFDFEFRVKFNEAIAKRREESLFNRLGRKALEGLEGLRYALAPRVPVLARSMAVLIFLMAASYHVYSIQPSCPVLIGKNGIVMVQCAGEARPVEIAAGRRLRTGDIISTKAGSMIDINLSNKYAVRLKESTKLRIAKLNPRRGSGSVNFELIEGEMLVSVEHGFKGSKFIVDSSAARATALGTKFSVDVSHKAKSRTDVSVLEGKVEVTGRHKNEKFVLAKDTVFVGAGRKTEVLSGEAPMPPQRLVEEEWRKLEELYQLGIKPQVILLLKNTPDRVKQLLRPCPIYIYDEKPRRIPELLENAVMKIGEAVKSADTAKHREAVKLLERIVRERPNPKYEIQLLLYIASYYEYIEDHKEAIKTFKEAVDKYPDSTFASLAQCAVGVIYDEKLHEKDKADTAFRAVLKKYPDSLEAIWIESKLGIKKAS